MASTQSVDYQLSHPPLYSNLGRPNVKYLLATPSANVQTYNQKATTGLSVDTIQFQHQVSPNAVVDRYIHVKIQPKITINGTALLGKGFSDINPKGNVGLAWLGFWNAVGNFNLKLNDASITRKPSENLWEFAEYENSDM